MNSERTDIVIGATSKIAREYLSYMDIKGTPVVAVSRRDNDDFFRQFKSVKSHVEQNLTSDDWHRLERVLANTPGARVIYFAARPPLRSPTSLSTYCEVNSEPIKRITGLLGNSKIPFVYISTDMVFGGVDEGFSEDSRPKDPFGKYGVSKFMGEEYTLMHPQGRVVRLGNVVGMRGGFLASVAKELKDGKEFLAWDNVFNRFTGIEEACFVINAVADYSGSQKVFHAASSDPATSRYDLATRFVHLCENRDILPENSSNLLKPLKHDFKDGRPKTLELKTEITQREIKYRPDAILYSLAQRISKGFPYLNESN